MNDEHGRFDNDLNNPGWPGDGSGLDDLADMNAHEVGDYRDELDDDVEPDFERYD